MVNLTMVLFRSHGSDGGDAVAAILDEIVRTDASRHSWKQIDVDDRPALAARYDVRITPTILLTTPDGDVLDRVVGTPSPTLLRSLLDARAVSATANTARRSRRIPNKTGRTS